MLVTFLPRWFYGLSSSWNPIIALEVSQRCCMGQVHAAALSLHALSVTSAVRHYSIPVPRRVARRVYFKRRRGAEHNKILRLPIETLPTATMPSTPQNNLALRLRSLCVPGNPLVLTNVYDAATASIVASHTSTKALATASYAIAQATGVEDAALDLETNLQGIETVAGVARKHDLPLTGDLQDGYDDVANCIKRCIAAGAVGGNLEDIDTKADQLRSPEDHATRIKTALRAASDAGVPNFVVNARTDVLAFGGSIDDAIARGRQYLDAGATTVYIWGGPKGRGVSRAEVAQLAKGLGGMINVKMNLRPGALNVSDLAELGVARISVGPEMFHKAMDGVRGALSVVAAGGRFG